MVHRCCEKALATSALLWTFNDGNVPATKDEGISLRNVYWLLDKCLDQE